MSVKEARESRAGRSAGEVRGPHPTESGQEDLAEGVAALPSDLRLHRDHELPRVTGLGEHLDHRDKAAGSVHRADAGLDLVHHAAMCLTCIVDGAEGRKRARYALRDALRELDRQGGGAKP